MPNYHFEHPKTGEVVEIFQHMNDPHVYEKDGIKYNRVWTNPNAAVDSQWNPLDAKDFAEKTGRKKGTLGDLYETSAELAAKRTQIIGNDPLKEVYYQDWSKERGGKKTHPDIQKAKVKKELSKKGVIYED